MRQRSGWKQRGDEALDKQAADARSVGNAYLRYWSDWAKGDPCRPRLAQQRVEYGDRYDDPDKLKRLLLRPVAEMSFVEDLAESLTQIVQNLPPDEKEIVLAVYLRVKIDRYSNTSVIRHIRKWHDVGCAEALKISRRTFYRRLASARAIVEAEAERMDLLPPPCY